jgi:hypothetical protein
MQCISIFVRFADDNYFKEMMRKLAFFLNAYIKFKLILSITISPLKNYMNKILENRQSLKSNGSLK